MAFDISKLFLSPESTIQDAITCIEANLRGIALIVDENRRLMGTIVDGDIRRAALANIPLTAPAITLLSRKPAHYARPITAHVSSDRATILELMREHGIRQLPLLGDDEQVVGLFTLDELLEQVSLPLRAVVMAGGFGKRLYPLTEDLPKPLLPVGDRPLMEHIINQLQSTGIRHVSVTTHYMAEKIQAHFGDGSRFGVDIDYIDEDQPLGTAGGVGLMDTPDDPLLVINGDILTQVNFRDMLAYHQECNAQLTVAVRKYDFTVPYGVVETENGFVHKLVEKPTYAFFVNAGIYLLNPSAHRLIPRRTRMDMTDLINLLLERGEAVASFPIHEYWLDIGQHTDYARAQTDIQSSQFNK